MNKIQTATATDTGLTRTHNEDAVYHFQQDANGLLIVADGMGGHQAGEIASALAIETIQAELLPLIQTTASADSELEETLKAAVEKANRAIVDYGALHDDDADLGTTLTAAWIQGNTAIVANVGDSRAYLLRDNQLTQITKDHSYVGELIRAGILEPESIFDHPRRSLILRSLGAGDVVKVDLFTVMLQCGDQLLLCSDGLWEMVHDSAEIAKILTATQSAETAAQQLIHLANHYGGEDNIGVAIAKIKAS